MLKHKIFSMLFTLLLPGCGHFYVKNNKKALYIIFLFLLLLMTSGYITVYIHVYATWIIFLLFYIYSMLDLIKYINTRKNSSEYNSIIKSFLFLLLSSTVYYLLSIFNPFTRNFAIPANSMAKTILQGDKIHVFKSNRVPQRGEIAVFRYPKNPNVFYVKRCIAKGRDEILFQDKHLYISFHEGEKWMSENFPKEKLHVLAGKTWVLNPFKEKFPGIQYDDDMNLFAQMKMFLSANDFAMQPVVVDELPKNFNADFNAFYKKIPMGEFYMVGDNRDHSNDSRFWGSVKKDLIYGYPKAIYFSTTEDSIRWNRIGKKIF